MRRIFYEVTFTAKEAPAVEQYSRLFSTLHAARNWVKWLISHEYVLSARIMKGGSGGMEVR